VVATGAHVGAASYLCPPSSVGYVTTVKLRLYHHHDGARIAYREAGTGPPLALLHSRGLSHREWEPIVDELSHRHRLVLPDLPLHGDSEDRPNHPYTLAWTAELLGAFLHDVGGPRPLVGGHDVGAMILLEAMLTGALRPGRLVLMPASLHRRPSRTGLERTLAIAARAAAVPGLDRLLSYAGPAALRPRLADGLTVTGNPAARDLLRHALMDLGGNANRARGWARAARGFPHDARSDLLDRYAEIGVPTLLLWADSDPRHPLAIAEEALDLLPDAQLRVLPRTGFLLAYDDPVGVARELAAFCV
jgi:pimeloyl-ACP methyl ester carboxylesterase